MLAVRNLSVAIQRIEILHAVSLDLAAGTAAGLIGRNGAGKTTLMRSIMGLLAARDGEIRFQDADLTHSPAHRRAPLGIGYMPEDRRLIPTLTVEENVLVPAWAAASTDSTARLKRIYELMPEVARFAQRKALQLSGGQQKLVALARAMMCGTRLLLLDEPFEGVAPALSQRLIEVIADLRAEGQAVLLSESDYVHSARLVSRLFVIERGAVREGQPGP